MDHPHTIPDHLVDAQDIAERLKVTTTTVWRRRKKMQLGEREGAWKVGSRNWRFDPQVFPKYFLGADGPPPTPSAKPPPVQDHQQERPTRGEAMTALVSRLERLQSTVTSLQATVTAQGEKLDHLNRLVMSALKSVIGGNHRGGSRSRK